MDDYDVLERNFIKMSNRLHCLAAQVHERRRLDEYNARATECVAGKHAFEVFLGDPRLKVLLAGERIKYIKADVVAGVFVFRARVAKPDDQDSSGETE